LRMDSLVLMDQIAYEFVPRYCLALVVSTYDDSIEVMVPVDVIERLLENQ